LFYYTRLWRYPKKKLQKHAQNPPQLAKGEKTMKNMFCVSQGNFSLARNNPLPTRFKGGRVLLK
jgi:hypothetical protein